MPAFGSFEELAKHVNTQMRGQIIGGKIMEIMHAEAQRLEKYLQEEIQKYYNSYAPKKYVRTRNWINSIRIGEPFVDQFGGATIQIYFDRSMAWHASVTSKKKLGYVPWLMEVGWDIRHKLGYSRPMFTHHPGSQYILKAVQRFNANNPYNLKVSVYYGNEKYI